MKAGILGVAEDNFEAIDSFEYTTEHGDKELTHCVEIRQSINSDNMEIQRGRAAVQELSDEETVEIRDGQISVTNRTKPVTRYTEFLLVPGEFMVVENGGGTFAFDLVGSQVGTQISRAEINLQEFWDATDGVSPWKAGFYAHQGQAETGVVYGDDVLKDSDFGGGIDDAQLNQLGLDYSPEDDAVKMSVTESGYIEIYQPDNYDEIDFVRYISSQILPYHTPRNR